MSSYLRPRFLKGSATLVTNSFPYRSCSAARDSSVVSCVVQVVREALKRQHNPKPNRMTNLSKDPGVIAGVSPTLNVPDFFAFFSKYFFARTLSLAAYSFSITLRSR